MNPLSTFILHFFSRDRLPRYQRHFIRKAPNSNAAGEDLAVAGVAAAAVVEVEADENLAAAAVLVAGSIVSAGVLSTFPSGFPTIDIDSEK